jgi:hypothetical protein
MRRILGALSGMTVMLALSLLAMPRATLRAESDRNQHTENSDKLHLDKRADILQAFCVHYYNMAMDHHTKAATTTNILLLVVAAIITVVGFDKQICGIVDLGGAIGVLLIGLFGVVWVWRQHDLYFFWEYIAEKYQGELKKIAPMFRTKQDYQGNMKKAIRKKARSVGACEQKRRVLSLDRVLWIFPHVIVAIGGVFLLWVVLKGNTCPGVIAL